MLDGTGLDSFLLFLAWSATCVGVGFVGVNGLALSYWLWVRSRPEKDTSHNQSERMYRGEWIPEWTGTTTTTTFKDGKKVETSKTYVYPAHRKTHSWTAVHKEIRAGLVSFVVGSVVFSAAVTGMYLWGEWPGVGMAILLLVIGLIVAALSWLFGALDTGDPALFSNLCLGGLLMAVLGVGTITGRIITAIMRSVF